MIPGMVEGLNNPRREGESFIAPGASLDPGFQATLRKAGVDDRDRPRKSALPEDYVRPWERDGANAPAKRYKPGED